MTAFGTTANASNTVFAPAYLFFALVLLLIVNVFNFMDRMLLSVLLQSIKLDLGLYDWQLGLITGFAFALLYGSMGIPLARWADRGSRRHLIAFALAVWSLMTALTGAAMNFLQLLLTRMGVGIGEAGCLPATHSLIADYFQPERRSRAMAIVTIGTPLGILLGVYLGGLSEQLIGWRWTFVLFGVPGLVVAAIVFFTLRNPPRGFSDKAAAADRPVNTIPTLRSLINTLSIRHIILGHSLGLFFLYGIIQWMPTFYIRSYGLNPAEVGARFGTTYSVGMAIGLLLGGLISDRFYLVDRRWGVWIPGLAYPLSAICFAFAFMPDHSGLGFAAVFFGSMFVAIAQAPTLTTLQTLAPPNMRATASALSMFAASLIGVGLGPFLIGVTSDLLQPRFGDESLRYALIGSSIIAPWISYHFYLASKTINTKPVWGHSSSAF